MEALSYCQLMERCLAAEARVVELTTENVAMKDINAWCKTSAFKNMYREFKTGQWITKNALRQWDKRRKESRRQKAVNEFYATFELNSLKPGSTVRLATKGDLTIMMFRSEGKAND